MGGGAGKGPLTEPRHTNQTFSTFQRLLISAGSFSERLICSSFAWNIVINSLEKKKTLLSF